MDDSKNAILAAILAFNLVIIGFQYFFNSGDSFGWLKMFGGIVLACIAAGAAFGVVAATKKK
jgi:hypothetical protein